MSLPELKLDAASTFEWHRHRHSTTDVPHYRDLLDFINMRAQASESSVTDGTRKSVGGEARRVFHPSKSVTSLTANTTAVKSETYVLCKPIKHPLYSCSKFKSLPHDQMIATVKANALCMNCLKPGHFLRQCKSLYRCRVCQKPHHSLLRVMGLSPSLIPLSVSDSELRADGDPAPPVQPPSQPPETGVPVHVATGLKVNALLMTCQVVVSSPD